MLDNLNDIDFELIIEKYKTTKFKATTPLFPKCKGIGDTKNEAITKLSNSISNFFKRTIDSYLKINLITDNYAEVITDPEEKDNFQHRIVTLGKNKEKQTQKVFLKSIYNHLEKSYDKNELSLKLEELNKFKDFSFEKTTNEKDDLIFGINLCLN
jgi:hypothetical protein